MNAVFVKRYSIVMATIVYGVLLLPNLLYAATITVNDTADSNGTVTNGKCSLREAIIAANTDSPVDGCVSGNGDDTIIVPDGVFTLTILGTDENSSMTGDLDIAGNVTLIGNGADSTIIDGGGLDRVFHVDPACTGYIVEIKGITIRNGQAPASPYTNDGGGVYNCGNLKISDSTISDNRLMSIGTGGGIYNKGFLSGQNLVVTNNAAYFGGGIGSDGTLMLSKTKVDSNQAYGAIGSGGGIDSRWEATLMNTTISNNSAPAGGGVRNAWHLRLINSTVSNNSATWSIGGGIHNESILDVTNSTISSNTANTGGGGISNKSLMSLANVTIANNTTATMGGGGAIYLYNQGILDIVNSLLANNVASGVRNNCVAPSGSITSYGYNLEDGNTCFFTAIGDKVNVDPLLIALQDNGGATFTHALMVGSPAIDAGNPAGCKADGGTRDLLNDQRSFLRPVDGDGNGSPVCDIGAYEFGAVPSTGSNLSIQAWGSPNPVALDGNLTYNILATNNGPLMADGVVITLTLSPNVTWVSSSTNNGVCFGNKTVTCFAGSLSKSDSVMPAIVVKVNAAGLISSSVTIASATPDPSVTNNSTTVTTLTSGILPVCRMDGITLVGSYLTLQEAFDAAQSDDTIEAMATIFSENITIDSRIPIIFKGGFDSSFASRVGYSTIAGKLIIKSGRMTVKNLRLKLPYLPP